MINVWDNADAKREGRLGGVREFASALLEQHKRRAECPTHEVSRVTRCAGKLRWGTERAFALENSAVSKATFRVKMAVLSNEIPALRLFTEPEPTS